MTPPNSGKAQWAAGDARFELEKSIRSLFYSLVLRKLKSLEFKQPLKSPPKTTTAQLISLKRDNPKPQGWFQQSGGVMLWLDWVRHGDVILLKWNLTEVLRSLGAVQENVSRLFHGSGLVIWRVSSGERLVRPPSSPIRTCMPCLSTFFRGERLCSVQLLDFLHSRTARYKSLFVINYLTVGIFK